MGAMRSFARFILAGPFTAILVTVATAVIGMLAPPLTFVILYASGAALALYSLDKGAQTGALVMGGATVTLALLSGALGGSAAPAVIMLVLWFPVWFAAWLLRGSRSLAWTLLGSTALMALAILVLFLAFGDPTDWWRTQLQAMVDQLAELPELRGQTAHLQPLVERLAGAMTGLLASGLLLATLSSLLLGRWWQSLVVHPGGLRQEFYALRLGQAVSVVVLVLLGAAGLGGGLLGALVEQWLLLLVVPFMVVGLAVIHALAAAKHWKRVWLVVLYVLMSLLPQVLMLVAAVGWLDPWTDPRRRLQQS